LFKCPRAMPFHEGGRYLPTSMQKSWEGEEVSVRERGMLGIYSKILFDHLDFFVVWKAAM